MSFTGIPGWAVLGLIGTAAAALALLHMLRVRPRELRVVTTLFWTEAIERTRARTLWERFRHPFTYVLLLTLCTLLALVLGRPERDGLAADRIHTVFVLDAGASSGAPEGNGTRLDTARARLLAEVGHTAAGDGVAIIVADPEPRLLADFDTPRPLISRRLDPISPSAHPAARERAVRLAWSLTNGRSRPRVVLITDRPLHAGTEVQSDRNAPELITVGRPAENAAIVSVQFTPAPDAPLTGTLAVRVAFYGQDSVSTGVSIERSDGTTLTSEPRELSAGELVDFAFPGIRADGAEWTIRLAGTDAVAVDNSVRYRLPRRAPVRVWPAADLPLTVRTALASDPAVAFVDSPDGADVEVISGANKGVSRRPSLVLRSDGPAVEKTTVTIQASSPWVGDLDFEAATSGAGAALDIRGLEAETLAHAGSAPLAAWFGGDAPRLELAAALYGADSVAVRRAAFAALIARGIHRLAGWEDAPVALTPQRAAEDPLWPRSIGNARIAVMPTDRDAADLSRAMPAEAAVSTGRAGGHLVLYEWLLALALLAFLVEGVLHARGRIA